MGALARLPAAALAIFLGAACMSETKVPTPAAKADARAGELSARPSAPSRSGQVGLREIGTGVLLYVPESYNPAQPMPLVVMLHGAGGTAQHSLDLVQRYADKHGFLLLAPNSQESSWDIISRRSYGPDVTRIDAALEELFATYAVDLKRVAIAGFSDGASYALSLGVINGELFSHVIAFSPGFMAPTRGVGSPHVFVSHGVQDRVLPIEQCSRRLVPLLERTGYKVDYVEFPGGHVVPAELAEAAFANFVAG